MRINPDRWCALTPGVRLLWWSAGTCILFFLAFWLAIRPVQRQITTLNEQYATELSTRAMLWKKARALYQAQTQVNEVPAPLPFSPLDFHAGNVSLVHWRPAGTGGELMLETDWAQIPALFDQLAQRGAGVSMFSVAREKGRLRFAVQVEHLHED